MELISSEKNRESRERLKDEPQVDASYGAKSVPLSTFLQQDSSDEIHNEDLELEVTSPHVNLVALKKLKQFLGKSVEPSNSDNRSQDDQNNEQQSFSSFMHVEYPFYDASLDESNRCEIKEETLPNPNMETSELIVLADSDDNSSKQTPCCIETIKRNEKTTLSSSSATATIRFNLSNAPCCTVKPMEARVIDRGERRQIKTRNPLDEERAPIFRRFLSIRAKLTEASSQDLINRQNVPPKPTPSDNRGENEVLFVSDNNENTTKPSSEALSKVVVEIAAPNINPAASVFLESSIIIGIPEVV